MINPTKLITKYNIKCLLIPQKKSLLLKIPRSSLKLLLLSAPPHQLPSPRAKLKKIRKRRKR